LCTANRLQNPRKGVPAMSETDKVFAGSMPELYDRYLGPLIFEPYAADMMRRGTEGGPSESFPQRWTNNGGRWCIRA
jgi:hypothetical protein